MLVSFGKFFEKSIEKCMGLALKFDSVGNHELIALDKSYRPLANYIDFIPTSISLSSYKIAG